MSATTHLESFSNNFTNWHLDTTPFLPKVIEHPDGNGSYQVRFNQAYIFDWNDSGRRIAIDMGGAFDVADGESKLYYLTIIIGTADGWITAAKVTEDTPDYTLATNEYVNIQALSGVTGPTRGAYRYVHFDLCEMLGPYVQELYLRENIHLWFRGHIQMANNEKSQAEEDGSGEEDADGEDLRGEFGIMQVLNSASSHGSVEFRSLLKEPDRYEVGEDNEKRYFKNQLEMKVSGNAISFFVNTSSGEIIEEGDTKA